MPYFDASLAYGYRLLSVKSMLPDFFRQHAYDRLAVVVLPGADLPRKAKYFALADVERDIVDCFNYGDILHLKQTSPILTSLRGNFSSSVRAYDHVDDIVKPRSRKIGQETNISPTVASTEARSPMCLISSIRGWKCK
jgi:hypothetical protein